MRRKRTKAIVTMRAGKDKGRVIVLWPGDAMDISHSVKIKDENTGLGVDREWLVADIRVEEG